MPEKKKSPTSFFIGVSAIWGFYLGFSGKSLDFVAVSSLAILLFIFGLYLYLRN
jgi:hypothetical protein